MRKHTIESTDNKTTALWDLTKNKLKTLQYPEGTLFFFFL